MTYTSTDLFVWLVFIYKCRKHSSYHKCICPDSSHLFKILQPMVWLNASPSWAGQVLIDSRTPDLFWHFSEEDESHFGSAYFSPVYAQMRNLGPFWSSLRGLSPLLFVGPLSAQAVWEEMYVWHRLNKHQPGSTLWWEPWKDPICRKKSEQLSKHCRRCESHLHHTVSLLSLFALPKMLPIPIRLWLFQLPLFAAFFALTSNPTLLFSATSYYAPTSSWRLNITASYFFLLHTLPFLFSLCLL